MRRFDLPLAIALVALIAALALVVASFAGCVTSRAVGPTTKYIEAVEQVQPDGGKIVTSRTSETGGASYTGANADKVSFGPIASSPKGGESGGTAVEGIAPASNESLVIYGISAGFVLIGLIAGYFVGWKQGALFALAGVGFMVAGKLVMDYAWVLIIPILLAVAGAGVWVYSYLQTQRKAAATDQALGAVVLGVERSPVGSQYDVKTEIGKAAGAASRDVKAVISAKKSELSLPPG